jgi:hypothetical protein
MITLREDAIKNIQFIYYKDGKQAKQTTRKKLGRRITNLLASLNFDKYSPIKINVRYIKGENSMTMKSDEDARWALQCFIKEYEE